ncbi:MAG: PD-(D/E)XK nuclease family protein [Myxococcota bacterium]
MMGSADVARNGSGKEVYSHSRLSSFENCPQKFQYRYLWKIPAESESIEGFVGKRVHEVLERLYKTAATGRVPTLPKVLWRYRKLFEEAYDPTRVRIVRAGTPLLHYIELGEHCLSNYYHDHYPFDGDETLAVEEHVRFDLDGTGQYRLQGFIDRIARTSDGTIEIQDYKTSARVPSQSQIDSDRQLALYQLGIGARFGEGRPVRLVWHYLRQGKTRVSTRTPAQLDQLRDDTRGLIDRIRSAPAFPAKTSALCRWCEYRLGCPASPERDEERPVYAPRPAATRPPRRKRDDGPAPAVADPGQLSFGFSPGVGS